MAYPSTFLDLQNSVAAKARMDTSVAADLSKIKDWINQAYAQTCVETEALQVADTMTLTVNQSSYTIPAAVVRIEWIVVKQPNQTGYNAPLTLIDLGTILRWRQSNAGLATTNGTAMYYCVTGQDDLELYPTPATADTLLMYYVKQPTALSANTDVPAIPEPYATRCLEAGAVVQAADYLKDLLTGYEYQQTFELWLQKFRQHLRRREGGQTKQFPRAFSTYRTPTDPSIDTRSW